jgi:hypothetical protein
MVSLRGAVLSFELMNGSSAMALAYGQVNDLWVVSGDQSSSTCCRLKIGRRVCSPSNAPTAGHGERAKTLPTEIE